MPNDWKSQAPASPPPLFSPPPPAGPRPIPNGAPLTHRNPSPTEAAAAERVAPVRENLRVRVLARIRAAGAEGMTAPELGGWYAREKGDANPSARREYSVRPRITELLRGGHITQAGGQRGGCTVFIATDKPGDGGDCPTAPAAAPRINAAARVIVRELLDALGPMDTTDLRRSRLLAARDAVFKLIEVPNE